MLFIKIICLNMYEKMKTKRRFQYAIELHINNNK